MATPAQPDTAQITGNVLFYSQPEPLSNDTHGKLGLKRMDRPFSFAAKSHVVPITVTEFPVAALSYPIIFAGDKHQPLAVMGVNADQNMFVKGDGSFEIGAYIPAYIRRYPFVLANDQNREQLVVLLQEGGRAQERRQIGAKHRCDGQCANVIEVIETSTAEILTYFQRHV